MGIECINRIGDEGEFFKNYIEWLVVSGQFITQLGIVNVE